MSKLETIIRSLCEVVLNYCEIKTKDKYPVEQFLALPHSEFIAKLQNIIKMATSTSGTRNTLLKYFEFEIQYLKPLVEQLSWTEEEKLKVHQHLYYLLENIKKLASPDRKSSSIEIEYGEKKLNVSSLVKRNPLSKNKTLSNLGQLLQTKLLYSLHLPTDIKSMDSFMKSVIEEHRIELEKNQEKIENIRKNEILNEQLILLTEANTGNTDKLEKTDKTINLLQDENNVLKATINELDRNIDHLKEEKELLIQETNQLKNKISESNQSLEASHQQRQCLIEKSKKIEPLEKENQISKQKINELEKQFIQNRHELENKIQKLLKELDGKNQAINHLTDENKVFKQKINELEKQWINNKETLEDKNQNLVKELERKNQAIHHLNDENKVFNQKVDELGKQLFKNNQVLEDKNQKIKGLENNNQILKILHNENDAAKEKIKKLEKHINKNNELLDEKSENIDLLRKKIDQLEKNIRIDEEQKNHLKTQLEEDIEKINELSVKNKNLIDNNKTLQQENNTLHLKLGGSENNLFPDLSHEEKNNNTEAENKPTENLRENSSKNDISKKDKSLVRSMYSLFAAYPYVLGMTGSNPNKNDSQKDDISFSSKTT